jgi:hypothetical protein
LILRRVGTLSINISMTIRGKSLTKTTAKATKGLILGRAVAEKLNAVEGIALTPEIHRAFAEFDRLGLTAEQRRRRLMKQFGTRKS